jgi:hypothetical protein
VRRHFIDRCEARAAALYLFLVTVADAQGLSYYGESTITARLHRSHEELVAARAQLVKIELIAYQAPLYQVLALPGTPPRVSAQAPLRNSSDGAVNLDLRLDHQLGRHRAQL